MYPQREYSRLMIRKVRLTKNARKALERSPRHVVVKLLGWIDLVENEGLDEARRIPGYHDELLRGQRRGQRSIRLTRAWRAIYVVVQPTRVEPEPVAEVTEISKHDY